MDGRFDLYGQDWRVIVNERGDIVADVRGDKADAEVLAASKDLVSALMLGLQRGFYAEWLEDGKERSTQEVIMAALKKAGVLT